MGAPVPIWPEIESPLLIELIDSLRKRSKAIKHNSSRWTCSAESEHIHTGRLESVTTELWKFKEPRLIIRLWSDGVLRLYVREHREQMWHFEFTLYAKITPGDGENVTKAIESSFAAATERDSSLKEQLLLSIWAPYHPYDIKRGRK